ncbi:MAG: hypothetical protein KC449_17595, partial [Anaerolineales bacterium]|nr:hypothetical protein [Anaerolineales bacterium]
MRVKKVWQILFFLILFGSVSCGGTETPTPTKPTLISEVSDSVTIIVGETQPDVRLIKVGLVGVGKSV